MVDKFNYLRSLLDGVAASAIERFSLPKNNYDAVNKLLEDLQLVISRKLKKGSWDAGKFMEEFKTQLEARERC